MQKNPSRDLVDPLAHVLWVCGAPDSGKTSVARALAAECRLQLYHFDQLD